MDRGENIQNLANKTENLREQVAGLTPPKWKLYP